MSNSSLVEEIGTSRTSLSEKKDEEKPIGKIKAASDIQQIFHTCNQANSVYYFTKAKSVKTGENKDPKQPRFTTYEAPGDHELFAYQYYRQKCQKKHHEQEMHKKYCCKTNARTRNTSNLLERLYVEDPEDVKGLKTLLDIDPEFFTIVEGRPILRSFSMSRYLEDLRDVLRTRLMAGFRNDEILLLDEKLKREKLAIEQINQNYTKYLNGFESALNEDYNESMDLLREAERAAFQTMDKTNLIRKLHTENAALEFTVHKLEERWRDLKMYQKFLYFVSPMSWRLRHDYIHRKELQDERDTAASSIFKKYTLSSQGHIPSLTNLVDEYLQSTAQEEEPLLYFTDAVELIKVFRFIEIQNLNCLLHTEEIEIPIESMRVTMEAVKKSFQEESAITQKMVDDLQKGIEWEESCSKELRDTAMKQIDTTLRKLVSDDEVLKLLVFIQDVYENCVNKNDTELAVYDMMTAIEQQYNNLVLKLDALPQHIVKKAEKHRFAEQARLAKLCLDTQQKIALVDSITWRLKKSLEPPFEKKRDLKWRSNPPEKPELPPPPPRELTTHEKDYLSFFTVYCALTDNVEDYGIDLKAKETNFSKFSILDITAGINK